jgi:hypothetical protein
MKPLTSRLAMRMIRGRRKIPRSYTVVRDHSMVEEDNGGAKKEIP